MKIFGKTVILCQSFIFCVVKMPNIQRTLVVLKPDSVGRSITWEIVSRFERAGLHIIGMKMLKPDNDFLYYHYETLGQMISRRGQKPFDVTLKMMQTWPVVAIVLEWVGVVEYIRKMVWTTEPRSAAPGTIRGDYAHMSFAYADGKDIGVPNLIHASGTIEEAEAEINHWFSEQELFSYPPLHHVFTR